MNIRGRHFVLPCILCACACMFAGALLCAAAAPARATAGAWTWLSPNTTRNPLVDVDVVSASQVWIVDSLGRLYSSHDDGTTWKDSDVERYPAAEHVYAVDFTDAQHGWIACASGAVLATSNGGTTWVVHDTGTIAELNSVSFVDQAHGWASGTRYVANNREYVVIRTSDGGDTWQTVSSLNCASVDFVDSSHGWAASGSDLFSTADGGATWTKATTPPWQSGSPEFLDVSFADQSHGWALGYLYGYGAGYALYATDDGGATWTISPRPELGTAGAEPFGAVSRTGTSSGWVVGYVSGYGQGCILTTTDGGASWSRVDHSIAANLNGVDFVNGSHGWTVGDGGYVATTVDSGVTWLAQNSTTAAKLTDVEFVDASYGWAVGENRTIIATSDGGQHWAPQVAPVGGTFTQVDFVDRSHGWVVDPVNGLLVTVDGGAHWTLTGTQKFTSVQFFNATQGYGMQAGLLYVTSDGGASWSQLPSNLSPINLYEKNLSFAFTDLLHGWIFTDIKGYGSGGVYATADGGATWQDISGLHDVMAASFPDQLDGWALEAVNPLRASNAVLATTDGGLTWTSPNMVWNPFDFGTSTNDICALDAAHCWAVGDAGTIIATLGDPPPPDTFAPFTQAQGWDGAWHGTDFTFTLYAYDGEQGSGVASTQYRVDGGAWQTGTTVTVPAPADHSKDGVHTVEYYSTDKAGNVETVRTRSVKIDTAPPAGSFVLNGGAAAAMSPLISADSAVSDASGTLEMRFSWDGRTTWTAWQPYAAHRTLDLSASPLGMQWIWGQYRDQAGNVTELLASIDLEADTIAPVTTVCGADALWHNKPVPLTFTATDNPGGSGVDFTEFKLDSGAWTKGTTVTVPAPADHSGDGVHTVAYRSTDKAGNVELAQSCQVKIDTTAPTVQAPRLNFFNCGQPRTVRFSVTDALSPSAAVTITLNAVGHCGRPQTIVIWSGTVPADGSQQKASFNHHVCRGAYRCTISATDLAGNQRVLKVAGWLVVR